jgi:Uncharacterized conserved protein
MIRQNIVNLYAHGSRVNLMMAEKDVVLTYALKMLEEEGYLGLVFKGGTCLRKCYFGRITRFSEDLDFQGKRTSDIKKRVLKIFDEKKFHGIRFSFSKEDIYETSESLGMDVTYSHDWNPGSVFKFQISLRGNCILPFVPIQVQEEVYAKYLEFSLPAVPCMALEEIIAEKIRALYQRATARDGFDLFLFSRRPFNEELVRKLVVLKMWDAHQDFDPERLTNALDQKTFNWYDIERLIRIEIRPEEIIESISARFSFLRKMEGEDRELLKDSRKHALMENRKDMELRVRELHERK